MANKRGLSDVVTTLLIILVAVAAVAIIGTIVLNQVQKGGSQITVQQQCQQISFEPVKCTFPATSSSSARVNVQRKGSLSSGLSLTKVQALILYADGAVRNYDLTNAPSQDLQSTDSIITDIGPTYNPKSVRVAAVLKASDGTDVTCAPSIKSVVCEA